MNTLTTIDTDRLATVTGGGNFLNGLDTFLGVLQSPAFGQIIGGIRDIVGSFGQQQGQQQQAPQQGQQQAAQSDQQEA